ncbi:hypothetical protein V5P93_000955 [Actinokineospora auranticolor]|uniref:EcsC family protein n=1 Tax=Actinokineospora auranticolor TaxID=155976 RepID=A0A2S6GYB3_9PSEU|nr:hypothetical protein [Actinokineospora auranticolor]PPK70167.1 hypothetical protein CLV40_10277 [Actinokineospora auranticolor]
MSEAVTDRQIVAILRPFVRATTPLLTAFRDYSARTEEQADDPNTAVIEQADTEELAKVERGLRQKLLDGLSSVKFPGTAAWRDLPDDKRADWWVNRVGRVTVLVASVPGIGGALADRLPIQDTLATASQGLVLSAMAVEYGYTDVGTRVRLIAKVLFDRDIDPALAEGRGGAEEDAATAEMTTDIDASTSKHGRVTLKAAGKALWRVGRTLWGLGDELDKRPQGRIYHKAIGLLPVVGMAGDYLGERSALKRAARRGRKWLVAQGAQ